MLLYNDNYELSTQLEIDELLSDLPLDLIKENISYQINSPISTDSNYLEIVLEKYEILKNAFNENSEALSTLETVTRDFMGYIITEMNDKYSFGIDINYEYDDIFTLVDNLYTYFILNYRKNVSNFFYRFIKDNKKTIVDDYEKFGKKKDVTTMNLKKNIKNKDDVIIISNLPSIMDYIKSLNVEPSDFIDYTMDDDNYEGKYIKGLIVDGRISGDFVSSYLGVIIDEDDIFDEIQVEIKMKLIKKMI